MFESVALPRARVRRKRRKPMPPGLWRWLIMVAIDVVYLAWSVIRVSLNGVSAWQMLVVAGWSAFLAFDWPRFKREWDAWRRDDD